MLHSVFLLLFMLVAAPLASYIPLAALAAVLAVVAWNMAEKHEFATLLRASRGDAVVLLVTFLLVVFRDLTEAIVVGFGSARCCSSTAWRRRSRSRAAGPSCEEDRADTVDGNGRSPTTSALATDPDVVVYRISGAFFFGAAAAVGAALDRMASTRKPT